MGPAAVISREAFTVDGTGGSLGGWMAGSGTPALLLHGGPGLSYSYLDGLAAELQEDCRLASFQQRGLEPSTLEGPFTVAQSVADAIAVLDGLGWATAVVVGHSWGGHLALRVAAAHPDRVRAALAVDPIGVVGDGGMAAFEAELIARTPKQVRERAHELDQRAMAGEGTPEDAFESLRLLWPSYFGDPEQAPPMPAMQFSIEAYSGIIGEVTTGVEAVAAELAKGNVPYGIVAGGASPIPWGQAARATVELSERAFLEVVPCAGHMVWLDAPGRVRAALMRLLC